MSTPSDRNLLFGLLALQMDLVTREQLLDAMQAWMARKADPLGLILQQRGALGEAERLAVERLVEVHAARHGGDTGKSLAAVRVGPEVRRELESIASLVTVDERQPVRALPPSPSAPTLPSTNRVRYRKVREHAGGGLGEVFVALDEELGREVALKEIKAQHADRPDFRARFVREAEVTGNLEHPGIVPVHGLGSYEDGRPYYAMRFVKGESLQEALERFHQADAAPRRDPGERELALRALLNRFVAVCNAVAYAHSRGVVHRDLKPANVMLGEYGETLVVDWGLAKLIDHSEGTTATVRPVPTTSGDSTPTELGQVVGTPAFMPPEQARGEHDREGPASDVFSLGATL